jgi:hypothetical protein
MLYTYATLSFSLASDPVQPRGNFVTACELKTVPGPRLPLKNLAGRKHNYLE